MNLRIIFLSMCVVVLAVAWAASCVIWRAAEIGELVAPIEKREFETLTVVAVGTGSAYENPERLGPTTAIGFGERVMLFDAGRGIAEALRKAKIPLEQPSAVFLTSLMPENTIGLDDLIYTAWLVPRETPLQVVGPYGTVDLIEGLDAAHRRGREALAESLGLPLEGSRVLVQEIGTLSAVESGAFTIEAIPLSGGPLPSLAWKVTVGDRSVVVAGTGWGEDEIVEAAEGASMLIHEAVYMPTPEELEPAGVVADPERIRREGDLHMRITEVGKLATRAGVPQLMLTRLRPPPFYDLQVRSIVANDYDGTILVPEDGDEIVP